MPHTGDPAGDMVGEQRDGAIPIHEKVDDLR